MCGVRSSWRWRLLAALLLLCSASSLAAAPATVTIPRETWDEIVLRVNLLGDQLDALTLSEKLLQEKLTEERQASTTALKLRDERIASLNDSLQRQAAQSATLRWIVISETSVLAAAVLAAAAYFAWGR